MIAMTGFSCLVCLLHINLGVTISVPVSVLGTVSVALGLLLAFRVNTAYDRYWEGRKLVQTVMGTIRNVARQIWINIPEETENDHKEKMRCIKLLLAFFVATKHHLRQEYGTNYYDLEILLPPKWVPSSVARTKKKKANMAAIGPRKSIPIDLDRDVPRDSPHRRRFNLFNRNPAICISKSNFIKPNSEGEYMEADDPTDIANIRRSLIQQEFPYSDISHYSAAQLQRTTTEEEDDEDQDDSQQQQQQQQVEEHEGTHLLDESINTPPATAVTDSPGTSSAVPENNRRTSYKDAEATLINRFKQQSHKGVRRHLDHSKFTSPEDLPYLGDSDISLPLEILFRVALYINQAKAQNKIESSLVSVTTNSIDTLVNSLTAFERIVHTPIPKAYNIHLKQAVMLYIFFLPFALVDTLGWLVAPVVTLVSFTLFGIEAIGAEIENPFGYDDNDLPLNRYCDELKKEVEYIIYHIPTKSTNILIDGQ
ncbi:hypothetical protein RO3G_05586 [Rhizopus delemar RA 99-880]|uniref:Bestrophin, RFP-TM, chloride channel-domain-containing protein n=2 Tax=Rhizopus delemar TaxID=936053 RepID=I1BXF1_RHIO9|nr:hypothetical protein RO3G_05586 [Rhizopus delemar RA 99-880]|eukprot:EIE80881.1 hypothetical protein RO3G_05586 [Rhizopus delemar RA 99-880]